MNIMTLSGCMNGYIEIGRGVLNVCKNRMRRFMNTSNTIEFSDSIELAVHMYLQHNRMRPLQQERRSKSFEERAEEYHRVRERIFAQNSTSPDTTQIEIRSKKDCGECMLNGRQGSVDAELMPSDLQPWSSTDSEVSCQRNIRPTVTKASSFGGISVLSRSDSNGGGTSSKPSICHLSKMGSDSSSSVSSTGSTTRPQYPAGQPPVANTHANRPTSTGNNRSGGVHTPPNYYLLPLDLAGIPPGSILINPQTGQPLLNSDGSLAVYNPPAATSNSQPLRSPMAPPLPSQHQMPPHMQHPPSLRHPILQHPPSLQHQQQQQQQQQQQPQQQQTILAQEDLGQHFGTMNLNRQTSAETSDPSTLYPMLPQASLQPGYLAASVPPSIGQHGMSHQGGYPGPSTSNHPQGYGHHPTQMAVYYCPTAQPPPSGQPFRSMTTLQYNSQRPTSTAFQPMATGQQLGYVAIPSAQGVIQGQQGGVASGVQGVVVPYPGISSYTAAPQGSTQTQTHPPQTFHPPVLLSGQAGPNTMPPSGVPQVYCSLGPAAAHNGLGSSMSYLPTPSLEQLNFPRTASPSSSQPTHAQHYTGVVDVTLI
uniref:SUZ domain-containing protein n=1 Tax=Eptatretus burgeri TaxID=7764 RepID=A0A8C4QI37_EPTBU